MGVESSSGERTDGSGVQQWRADGLERSSALESGRMGAEFGSGERTDGSGVQQWRADGWERSLAVDDRMTGAASRAPHTPKVERQANQDQMASCTG